MGVICFLADGSVMSGCSLDVAPPCRGKSDSLGLVCVVLSPSGCTSCGVESVEMFSGVCDCVCASCRSTARLICFSSKSLALSLSSSLSLSKIRSLHVLL